MVLATLALLTPLAAEVLDFQSRGNVTPYLVVFLFGFAVGIAGHLAGSREMILAGILIAGVAATLPWLVWGGG